MIGSRVRNVLRWSTTAAFLALAYLTWYVAPDWTYQPEVAAPLTRKILFFHPASAWAAFVAYFLVFAASVALLRERDMKYDRPAQAAAEVGFAMNTIALITGTIWGTQEWSRTGQSSLATVYSEPKVLVVVLLWLTFAAYLLVRRLVDGEERRARLAAVFGVLGFVGVPISFATSRLLSTSLHPDIAGPGKNPDAAVGDTVGMVIGFSMLAFFLLLLTVWQQRLRVLRAHDQVRILEAQDGD